MPRYIDADELLKKSIRIEGHFDLPSGKAQNFSAIDVTEIIDFPTADVAPIVHGHWIHGGNSFVTFCSVCDYCFEEDMYDFDYCSNCGAKMDGDENG